MPPDPLAQRRIGDRAEDGDPERAAHRAGEHGRAGDDAAALPARRTDWAAIASGWRPGPSRSPITKQVAARCQTELPESTVSSSAAADDENGCTDQRGRAEPMLR